MAEPSPRNDGPDRMSVMPRIDSFANEFSEIRHGLPPGTGLRSDPQRPAVETAGSVDHGLQCGLGLQRGPGPVSDQRHYPLLAR